MCFNNCSPKYARSITSLIKSTVEYWTWNMKKKTKTVCYQLDASHRRCHAFRILDVISHGMEDDIVSINTGVNDSDE